jgi:autotransporter translocation and assembly factor TamB
VRILKQGQRVTADPIELVRGNDRLELRGSYDAAAGQLGRVRLQLNAKEIGPYVDALAPQGGGLRGGASAMIEASGPLDQPDFTLDLFVQQIQTAGLSLGDTRIQASGGGRQIRIESAETMTPAGRLQAAGRLTRNPAGTAVDAIVENLSLEGTELRLALAQPARMRYETPRRFSVDRFDVAGPQGRIAVHGELALEGRSDLTVELTGVSGAGWLAPLAGVPLVIEGMDVALRAQGTAAAPEIALNGTVRRLGAEGEPMALAGRFDLAYSAKRLRIDACEWTGSEGSRFALAGVLPIDPAGAPVLGSGALTVAAEARLPGQELLRRLLPAWPVASGSLDAELSLEGTWAAPRGTLRVSGWGLNPADPPRLAPPGPYEARLEMAIEARRMLLPVVEVRSAHAQLQGAGVWQDYPTFGRWVAGRPAVEGTVALEARLSVPDLGWLAPGFHDIRRVAGRLDVDLKLEGPLRDPRLAASLRLTDGELRPEAEMPPLQALNLEADFAGRDLTIRSMRGELGGAPFQLSGSMADIWALDGQRRVDLRLEGQNLLLYRSQTLRARADANLRLAGPPERLVLSGSLSFTDGLFAKNFGLAEGLTAGSAKPKAGPGFSLFSMEAPPLRDMRFDVCIDARRPFQVKNNLVRGAVRPDLNLVGTGEAPELVGKVYLDATTLFLPAGRMQFESGVIHFEAVDPGRPRLDMVGHARMLGYDITAAVEGPYDEPAVSLSAVPPLADAELLALVLTGQPPKTPGSEPVEKRQGLNVAVFIGRDVLMRMPGGGGTESLQTVLERFDVEVGRSVTRAGDETINARFRIADGLLRKGDTLYLTGEKDVFDHYNAGVRIVFRFR